MRKSSILSALGRGDKKATTSNNPVPQMVSAKTGKPDDPYVYIVDTNTGVVYLKFQDIYFGTAITVMLNSDGTPVTAEQLGIEY